jgi:hypothetical protein
VTTRDHTAPIADSRALWNRQTLNLASDEIVAQILERGELEVWRSLYRLAEADPDLRRRLKTVVLTVPLPLPRLWLAALASLGEAVDLAAGVPDYYSSTTT